MPGSLASRKLVAARAQQYLDGLARDAGDDAALLRDLAESYLRLGDVLAALTAIIWATPRGHSKITGVRWRCSSARRRDVPATSDCATAWPRRI